MLQIRRRMDSSVVFHGRKGEVGMICTNVKCFPTVQPSKGPKKSYPTLDGDTKVGTLACPVSTYHTHSTSSPAPKVLESLRKPILPSEHHERSVTLHLLSVLGSRLTEAKEAGMLRVDSIATRVRLQSTDRAASACHGAAGRRCRRVIWAILIWPSIQASRRRVRWRGTVPRSGGAGECTAGGG